MHRHGVREDGDDVVPADQDARIRQAIGEIWNAGLVEAADALFDRDCVNHGGLIPDLVSGLEAIKLGVVVLRLAFPGLHVTVTEMWTDGETTIVRWTAEDRRLAPRDSRRHPDDASMSGEQVLGATRVRWARGVIVESWTSWDRRPGRTAPDGMRA